VPGAADRAEIAGARLALTSMPPQRPLWRVWLPNSTGPLPSQAEALALPLKAFPGWSLCIRCGRCGGVNEAQTPWQDVRLVYVLRRPRHAGCQCDRCGETLAVVNAGHSPCGRMPLVYILRRMRHAGCGGEPSRVELRSGVEWVTSRPVRRIVLRDD